MGKIPAETYKEIRQIILAGELFPDASLALRVFLNHCEMGVYYNVLLSELQNFVFKNPELKNSLIIGKTDSFVHIDLLKETKEIFSRFIAEEEYNIGIMMLNGRNKIPNGFNQEITECKKCRTCDLKNELLEIRASISGSDKTSDAEEKAASICICIFESIIYSRSLLGKLEGLLIKRIFGFSLKNIKKEILLSI